MQIYCARGVMMLVGTTAFRTDPHGHDKAIERKGFLLL
jgi:hypothetical protein